MSAIVLDVEALRSGLEQLRRPHLECEDCWYSCPKSAEGCCNDLEGDECNCGADAHNAAVDSLLALLPAADGV